MTDIASDVGINKASIYYFFKNKQQIYLHIIEDIFNQVIKIYSVNPIQKSKEIFCDVVEQMFNLNLDNGMLLRINHKGSFLNESDEKTIKIISLYKEMFKTISNFMKKAGSKKHDMATMVLIDASQGYMKRVIQDNILIDKKEFIKYLSEHLLT